MLFQRVEVEKWSKVESILPLRPIISRVFCSVFALYFALYFSK